MKKILLASASIVAFAGVASAEVSFGGDATLGYNSVAPDFYWELNSTVTFTQALDNGLTAGATIDLSLVPDTDVLGDTVVSSGYELSLTGDNAGLYFGDTATAASSFSAGSALDGAPETDFDDNDDETNEATLRGEASFGGVDAKVSYGVVADELVGLQVYAEAALGAATVTAAYQDADHNGVDGDGDVTRIVGEAYALGVAFTAGAADVNFGYLSTDADTSIGAGVDYTAGALSLGASFTSNDVADDAWTVTAGYDLGNGMSLGAEYNSDESWEISGDYASGDVTVGADYNSDEEFNIDVTYGLGNGLDLFAGLQQDNDYYAGATYDLGGGASVLVSYATLAEMEPAEDLNEGTTVELTFEF